jgi:hypothetical protein
MVETAALAWHRPYRERQLTMPGVVGAVLEIVLLLVQAAWAVAEMAQYLTTLEIMFLAAVLVLQTLAAEAEAEGREMLVLLAAQASSSSLTPALPSKWLVAR